jgi:FkbM family methyltransferase
MYRMIEIFKKIFQEVARLFTYRTSRKLRNKIYSLPLVGHYLQNLLKNILYVILYRDNFQQVKFKFGPRKGLVMRLKLPEDSEFYLETHDPDVTDLLCKYIKPGFTVVDAGAHIGYFTLLISRLVGPRGKVFALEPLPKNIRRLEEHLSWNHCNQNTQIFPFALAEQDGEEKFLYFDISTIGRLASSESKSNIVAQPPSCITVKCRSLDALFQNLNIELLDFVKIDVEGAEFRALQGMSKILNMYRPKLLIEVHNEKNIGEIFNFLEKRDYRAYINGKILTRPKFFRIIQPGKNILFIHNKV